MKLGNGVIVCIIALLCSCSTIDYVPVTMDKSEKTKLCKIVVYERVAIEYLGAKIISIDEKAYKMKSNGVFPVFGDMVTSEIYLVPGSHSIILHFETSDKMTSKSFNDFAFIGADSGTYNQYSGDFTITRDFVSGKELVVDIIEKQPFLKIYEQSIGIAKPRMYFK